MRVFVDPLYQLALLSGLASLYYFTVSGGVINGSSLADIAAGFGPPYFIAIWALRDSEKTHYWPALHYGLWVLAIPAVMAPHYVLKSRGRAGAGLAIYLCAAALLPWVCSLLGFVLYEDLPDFR